MEKLRKFIQDYWKTVLMILGVIGMFTTVIGVDDRYAKTSEVATQINQVDTKQTAKNKELENNVAQTLNEFKKV